MSHRAPESSRIENARIQLGKKGEELVAQYLAEHGFYILERNYTQRCGEIDLIARKGEVLAFVEVKMRRHAYFNLSEVVNFAKQRKIIQTALHYIARHHMADMVYRFDVALLEPQQQDYHITYIPNAFTASEEF